MRKPSESRRAPRRRGRLVVRRRENRSDRLLIAVDLDRRGDFSVGFREPEGIDVDRNSGNVASVVDCLMCFSNWSSVVPSGNLASISLSSLI